MDYGEADLDVRRLEVLEVDRMGEGEETESREAFAETLTGDWGSRPRILR
jgi:hypothetical protein